MTFPEFDEFQSKLIEEVVYMKTNKGKEYANSADRFANFDRLAADLGLKNYQVGWVYTKKHLDSIAHYCKVGPIDATESIRGRFVDAICYLTLMAGMVAEEESKAMAEKQPSQAPQGEQTTVLSTGEALRWGGSPTVEQAQEPKGLWCCLLSQSSGGLSHSGNCKYSQAICCEGSQQSGGAFHTKECIWLKK